ncbi:chlorophyll synthesis pathway protein BchC [Humitalea sp. 24SJ18S-53]|uniref:chlorophyll synthesis pathway protein BchC n=1 Tax=Humitalea sp. 24SJ18S-53 TaxID=3422307 RepID=UPI003D668FC3
MDTVAIVMTAPQAMAVRRLDLTPPGESDVVVDVDWSGISTGTERLLWSGRMPSFPGMGYPLVPGYEAVGRVTAAGKASGRRDGDTVFVPGARCFGMLDGMEVRGLFGGAAKRLVVPGARTTRIKPSLGEHGILMALAATAWHAISAAAALPPDLIVGHGVLGCLLARLTLLTGAAPPTVWETQAARLTGAAEYPVLRPEDDERRDYRAIYDASGDAAALDGLIARLAPGGEIVLAGFYADRVSFAFPPAFMREARLRVAAEWRHADMLAVAEMIAEGRLCLDGLITHRAPAEQAEHAYRTAFDDVACLKLVLDWRSAA